GYQGLVIKNEIKGIVYNPAEREVSVRVGSGEGWDELVAATVTAGYWGLENLSSIPGTVGATPVQNVGAYGVEVASLITQVEAVHIDTLELKEFSNSECQFAYRDSYFKSAAGRVWVITAVTFSLATKPNPKLDYGALQELSTQTALTAEQVRHKVQAIRAGKFPNLNEVGTAGSFFKNPIISAVAANTLKTKYPDLPCFAAGEGMVKVSLGWVLDKVCGLKGYCHNGVCLYENQALVLVNEGAKDARTVDDFAFEVARIVEEKTGIKIEREVRCV
ncbi:UDP-N-acetylmuramate dehydrogenase, partial [Candidatus Kaiserbacteria bacterium]|nr:UDP-N-acetylmuramate dehydrogenase [Candidatus Kaiserbacteria bacterium]